MFSGFFNYDNPIWRSIGKLWDVIVANFLWFVCSIPIVTIGASTTALYYVTLRLVRDEDGYTFRSFFHSFKQNFKQATIIWLLVLVSGVILLTDLWFTTQSGVIPAGGVQMVLASLFFGMGIVWLIVVTYVFAELSRFYGSVKRIILNSFLMAIKHIFYTLAILVLDVAIVALILFVFPFLIIFGMGLIAYVNSFFMNRVFNKYIPKEERDDGELRPILEDVVLGDNGTAEESAAPQDNGTATEENAGGKPEQGFPAG